MNVVEVNKTGHSLQAVIWERCCRKEAGFFGTLGRLPCRSLPFTAVKLGETQWTDSEVFCEGQQAHKRRVGPAWDNVHLPASVKGLVRVPDSALKRKKEI